MHYPADIEQAPSGEWSVQFPDVPAANVAGLGTLDEAVEVAPLVLCVVLDAAVRKGQPVPLPSDCAPGQAAVQVPWSLASRLREVQDTAQR
jgi:predicted RNase H-like HicB family nuclease